MRLFCKKRYKRKISFNLTKFYLWKNVHTQHKKQMHACFTSKRILPGPYYCSNVFFSFLLTTILHNFRAISKLLGERWRELCEEKREDFSRMAKEMADERMKVNPDCWKRKHRKEKDTGSKSSSGDGESPDCKKAK